RGCGLGLERAVDPRHRLASRQREAAADDRRRDEPPVRERARRHPGSARLRHAEPVRRRHDRLRAQQAVAAPAPGTVGRVSRSVIVSAVRTPFGRLGGGLKDHAATELGAIVIRAALERVGLEGREVEYVIMGQVLQGGAGQAPARQAAVGAGLPIEVPADTVNKVCASSIRAIEIADSMIRAGDVDVVVTGGMESMSNAPYALPKARFGYRLGDATLVDLMIWDGLRSTFDESHMIQQAARVNRELGISREDQDAWALRSHDRAAAAQDAGRFDDEIVPVGDVTADEAVRRDTTLEKLA